MALLTGTRCIRAPRQLAQTLAFGRLWLLLLLCLAIGGSKASAQSAEYKIKSVFLFNFAQFVEWPESAFPRPQSPMVIGILGVDPFGRFLDETVRNEKVNGHPLQVVRFRSVEEITSCHILFISQSEAGRIDPILAMLKDKPVLTISEIDRFAMKGGMVRFITEENKVRFRINVEAAQEQGLAISSKLLRFAEIVTSEKEK